MSRVLASVPNFRDVAERVPGLQRGRLFRSDLIVDLDPADAAFIRACGISCVVDLRGEKERAHRPNHWFEAAGAEIIDFDIAGQGDPAALAAALRSGDGAAGAQAMMRQVFRQFPAGAMPALDVVSRRLASGAGPLLIHCAAGKDRTGFVVAALLIALGIELTHVEADFMATRGRVHQRTRDHARKAMRSVLADHLGEEALAAISDVHPSFLHAAIAEVEQVHGSFDRYLAVSGIDRERAAAMRTYLLEVPAD